MKEAREVTVEEARKHLGRLVDSAALDGVTVYLTRRGRRFAAIVPLWAIKTCDGPSEEEETR